MKSPNRVFVTGSGGKVGKKLVVELTARGFEAVRLKTDINNIEGYKQDLEKCEYVIHLAAYQNIKDKNIDEFERVNVLGTKTILEASIHAKVKKFIYISTVMVFEETGNLTRDEKWKKKKKGNNFYEETKIRALKIVKKYKNKLPIVVVYPTVVVDKEDFNKFNFPGWLMCRLGSPKRIINFINNKVLARALANIIEKKSKDDYILAGKNTEVGAYLKEVYKFKKRFFIPWFIPGVNLQNMCFSNKKAKKDSIMTGDKLDIFS